MKIFKQILFNLSALILFAIMVSPLVASAIEVGATLIAGLSCLWIGNMDKIKWFKATTEGFEAETRELVNEAKSTLYELKKLSKTMGKILLTITNSAGRWGGIQPEDKWEIRGTLENTLDEVGLGESEVEEVLESEFKFICHDYVSNIRNALNLDQLTNEQAKKWQGFLNDELSNKLGDSPSPDVLEECLKEVELWEEPISTYVRDYQYYYENRDHRDIERWLNHTNWSDR